MSRRLHRRIGVLLAVPFLLWMATGLLFHVKHRYGEAYEALAVPPLRPAPWSEARIPVADLIARGALDAGPVSIGADPRGIVAFYGTRAGKAAAVDAATGAALPLADEATARAWAARAIARSPNAARYGELLDARESTARSRRTGVEDAAFAIRTAGGKTITVDRVTGELSQTGDLNDWIDLTYRVHYLQWTPWQPVNIALVLAAILATVVLVLSGIRMAWTSR